MSTNTDYSYKNLISDTEKLEAKYPFITVSSIGRSLVGRPLPLIKIGKGKKSVLFVGTHHGMESITSLLLMKYAEEYCEAVSKKTKTAGYYADFVFETRSIYIVPMLNPDGTELRIFGKDPENPLTDRLTVMSGGDFSRWQANGRGVDLNHNYNAGFSEYKTAEKSLGISGGCPTRFSGEHPESEPETSALCGFIRASDISMLMSLHTQGREIYADFKGNIPFGGTAIAKRLSSLSGYTVAKPEPAASCGGLKDWFISEFSRPAFTVECGKGVNPLPVSEAGSVYSEIRRMLLGFVLMG